MTGETRRPKAGNGEDSIYWDESKQRWVGAVSLGYAPSGKRRRPKVYGKTKTEVRGKLRELRKDLDVGDRTPANFTVADAVNGWLARGLKGRDPATVTKNRILAEKHVVPLLGRAKLRELTADDVDDWLDDRAEVLAASSLRVVLSILRRSIDHAMRREKVRRNVALLVDVPEGQTGRPSKALTLEQARAVLVAAQRSRLNSYVVLSLLVGVRTEEARPLIWDHVQLSPTGQAPPHVEVWRSVRRHGDTKTRKARRTLRLPALVAAVLTEHRRSQQDERIAYGLLWDSADLVFATNTGQVLDAANVRRAFRSIVKAAGLESEWTPRELRHSFVSLMSDHGIPVEKIARVVGHSSSTTTEVVYRKQLRPVITEGADAMDVIFAEEAREADQ
ncbi:tyrosine-type recombinase/integrase [Streptomyces sp. H10-C2]|uniref:site-specific integrase n=1 Tax=unclassified Streptomyces TaxID=2593676 RepID=UPI0024B950B1|nr:MULTISPECIES: tyrosine-type recombinase/integrase [unclassified Streptomyces]MDJ0346337.1 tyrosine-type recombinase/integrase [Streptomyces sp. PH10-H1]MDJ0370774.1 tyrosine-type recombinase/integrase [Streptomyces sp. H10-C2]